jgi:Mrp family chromosome partitioning ATPase
MTPEILQETSSGSAAMMPYPSYSQAALVPSECDRRLVFLHEPHGPSAEQYRRIVTRIISKHPAGGTLMITSPAPEDGKTLSALNLSFCLAERSPVLLVDLDTRHCSVRGRLGLGPVAPSIEDALLEVTPPADCVLSIAGTRLCVASNRGTSHTMIELMAAGRPERFLAWAERNFMWIIFDTPPAFPIADTLEIARHTTVGMLVVRARKTPARLVKQTIDALKGHLHFVMLNDAEAPSYAIYNKCYYFEQGSESRS